MTMILCVYYILYLILNVVYEHIKNMFSDILRAMKGKDEEIKGIDRQTTLNYMKYVMCIIYIYFASKSIFWNDIWQIFVIWSTKQEYNNHSFWETFVLYIFLFVCDLIKYHIKTNDINDKIHT